MTQVHSHGEPHDMAVEFEGPMGIFRGADEVSDKDLLRGLTELAAEAHKRGLLSLPLGHPKPGKSGFYWLRCADSEWRVVEVQLSSPGELWIYYLGQDDAAKLDEQEGT